MPGAEMSAGERAFVYAKSCGIIGKSFVEKRLGRLSAVSSPLELENMVFPLDKNDGDNLDGIETKIAKRAMESILSVVGAFQKTPEILALLVRVYEYNDLKRAISAMCSGEEAPPERRDLRMFSTVRFEAYPNLKAMLKGTEFGFLLKEGVEFGKIPRADAFSALLDGHYYAALLAALARIPKRDCLGARHLFSEEISLLNCSLALRMRAYYGMKDGDVRSHLIGGRLNKYGAALDRDAVASLSMELDHRADWQDWRRRSFLNSEGGGKYWKCSPRHFQNAASVYLYRLARRYFRRRPFSLDTACCFIRLKQFEEQALTGIAEGAKLHVGAGEVFKTLNIQPGGELS
ncbi:MAG: V-type ATPase subunit [Spirochaetaceae bacterium]|jgi:vacuolar-type H+-ATPase subunit C/Vma6|nr:V-type ATPase subunit [Spirochaetaceae bacterium]